MCVVRDTGIVRIEDERVSFAKAGRVRSRLAGTSLKVSKVLIKINRDYSKASKKSDPSILRAHDKPKKLVVETPVPTLGGILERTY
jgi:hypothetical protein